MEGTHTMSGHGTGALGHRGAESGRWAGARGGLGGGDVSELRGNGGEDDDLWAGLRGPPNHPDRLLVGGLLGPRRGVVVRDEGPLTKQNSLRKTSPLYTEPFS